eukprot:g57640.t1
MGYEQNLGGVREKETRILHSGRPRMGSAGSPGLGTGESRLKKAIFGTGPVVKHRPANVSLALHLISNHYPNPSPSR